MIFQFVLGQPTENNELAYFLLLPIVIVVLVIVLGVWYYRKQHKKKEEVQKVDIKGEKKEKSSKKKTIKPKSNVPTRRKGDGVKTKVSPKLANKKSNKSGKSASASET